MEKEIIKGCETCIYAMTHFKCRGCISDDPEAKGKKIYPYLYANYEFGTWEEQEAALMQEFNAGRRSIVIGWSGEAEVNVKRTMQETLEHLTSISCECGYYTRISGNNIEISKDTGKHILEYDRDGLKSISCSGVYQWQREQRPQGEADGKSDLH